MLQGTDRIPGNRGSLRGGTSTDGTHRAPPDNTAHRRSSGPSLPAGCVVPQVQPVLRPPPTPTRPAIHFPVPAGYRTPRSGDNTAGHRAGEGLPSSRRHPRYVPRPLRRGVPHGCASRLCTASMAFTLITGARHSLAPPSTGGNGYDAAGFASCYGPHRRSPFTGLLTLGSDPARFQTRPPACYRASWQLPGPDFHRQATTSLRTRRNTMALRHGFTSRPPGRT